MLIMSQVEDDIPQ